MIQQYSHLNSTAHSPFHGCKDTLSFLVTAQGEIFDMNEFFGAIDLLADALEDLIIMWE